LTASRLRISEIFFSLQGEASRVGLPTVFIRLTGCPLRCGYCDTDYAFQGGDWRTLTEIMQQVRFHPTRHVTVTGGEPLAQKACHELLRACAMPVTTFPWKPAGRWTSARSMRRVARIVDLKTPASGEVGRNLWSNLSVADAA
jgi:7-carboxy-7-deazaguanine synthase